MGDRYYNGYSWSWRVKILQALDDEKAQGRTYLRERCDMCGDRAAALHSEDYSQPYSFVPPQTYSLCRGCHWRIHRRFSEQPEEWAIWLAHVRAGGYGNEFTQLYSPTNRLAWYAQIQEGHPVRMGKIRGRLMTDDNWWERLSLDPEILRAAWARPRTLRPRPSSEEFADAIAQVGLSSEEAALLKRHALAPRCSISIQKLSGAFSGAGVVVPPAATYKSLGRRLSQVLDWEPDRFRNGYPNWTSLLAECWKPEGREPEWVLVQSIRELISGG